MVLKPLLTRKRFEKCEYYGLLGEIESKLSSSYNIPTMFLIIAILYSSHVGLLEACQFQ